MKGLLIHGCYDSDTLTTIRSLGIKEISFDLRGRSFNLISYKDLLSFLSQLSTEKIFLNFENDKKETILSYLNLLQNQPFNFNLIFRDSRPAEFYHEINLPFYWMFSPEADWKSILSLPTAEGVFLPLKYQQIYPELPELWKIIDARNISVYLHASTFEETLFLKAYDDLKISIDLSPEIEKSFRCVDQVKLKDQKIWRRWNETFTRQ